jgi:hypothetical protein
LKAKFTMKYRNYYLLLLCAIVISCGLPANNLPAFAANTEFLKWTRIDTPGSVMGKSDVISPSEVSRIVIGSDGKTFYSLDIPNANNSNGGKALYKSVDSGKAWSDEAGKHLYQAMPAADRANFRVWNIAVAPDNASFLAVATNYGITSPPSLPRNVWFSSDGGNNWQNTNLSVTSNISAIDIAKNNGNYIVAVGTRNGTGGGNIHAFKSPGYGNWKKQELTGDGDIMALKFSPNFAQDNTLAIVYSTFSGTYLNAGIYDLAINNINWNIIYGKPLEITTSGAGTSPKAKQIISADLELPSNFSGQAPSFRRYYISIDAPVPSAGIYRFDDTVGYWLMTATSSKRIASIAYFGSYNEGKLLAGEVLGDSCSATVMTWFTDAPTTCPVTCWYQAVKPPSGAAGAEDCAGPGYGNAQVAWSPDGMTAYAGTSSSVLTPINWTDPYLNGKSLDESSFSISRNNGQTWNQLALIDTRITRFSDIAPSPDGSTLYLASTNNSARCSGFDSVWRSQSSPIGSTWERILCKPTTAQPCASGQSDTAILRLAGDKANGQVLFWAAVDTRTAWWSADQGDWWGSINPRFNVQDMAAEDSNTMYILSNTGQVQKFSYTGTGWTSPKTINTGLDTGYSIATAYTGVTPESDKGNIIVGGTGAGNFDIAYSTDGGTSFKVITKQLPTRDNTMVLASSSYRSDGYILAVNSGGMYAWGIYNGEMTNWESWWGGESFPSPVTGLAISRNYSFYFPTPSSSWSTATPYVRWSAATAGLDASVSLGTQPTTRFKICGGLNSGDTITVYAIDQRSYIPPTGGVWCYTDCLAWQGPLPLEPISLSPVNFDPVTGRAGEVDLRWEHQCLSKSYRIQLSNDIDFTLLIADIGKDWAGPFYTPPNLDMPALMLPLGGGKITDANGNKWTIPPLQANHTYHWRIMVKNVATGDNITSPWSWRESFIIKQGLPVTTPYHGAQLLAPDNSCNYPYDKPETAQSPIANTQIWALVIMGTGTILAIILIVLILRRKLTSHDYY